MTDSERATPAPLSIVKKTLVVLAALFVFVGPAYRQSWGGKAPMMPRWVMFSGMATGYVAVRVETSEGGGPREPVPWDEFMPRAKNHKGPVRVQRIMGDNQLERLATRLCRARGPNVAVFIQARQANRRGWKNIFTGDEDQCLRQRKLPRRRRSRREQK